MKQILFSNRYGPAKKNYLRNTFGNSFKIPTRWGNVCLVCVFFLTCLVEVKQTEYFKIFSNKRHTTKQETLSRRYAIRLVIEKVALGAPW